MKKIAVLYLILQSGFVLAGENNQNKQEQQSQLQLAIAQQQENFNEENDPVLQAIAGNMNKQAGRNKIIEECKEEIGKCKEQLSKTNPNSPEALALMKLIKQDEERIARLSAPF